MWRKTPALACLLLAGTTFSLAVKQEKPQEAQAPAEEYKIPPEDVDRHNPVKPTEEGLAQARKLYRYHCVMCHGALGDGKGELAETMKLTLRDWRDPEALKIMKDGELFYIISIGKGKMVGEGDRQKEEMRWNLVRVVRSFAKKGAANAPKPKAPK